MLVVGAWCVASNGELFDSNQEHALDTPYPIRRHMQHRIDDGRLVTSDVHVPSDRHFYSLLYFEFCVGTVSWPALRSASGRFRRVYLPTSGLATFKVFAPYLHFCVFAVQRYAEPFVTAVNTRVNKAVWPLRALAALAGGCAQARAFSFFVFLNAPLTTGRRHPTDMDDETRAVQLAIMAA